MKSDNTTLFEKTPIPKAIIAMVIPTLISQIITVIYNMADTFFIGQMNDPNQIAAASLAMPPFIMLTGIAFGAEAGFMTGAVTAFVSNFFFSQGPWTPWQMFAYGMAGFLAGVLYKHGFLSTKRISLSIFGAAMVLIIIGPLLDTASIFTMITDVTLDGAIAVYTAGLGMNAVHAGATFITLLLLSKFILDKLERIKTKYGIMEN